MNYIRHKLNPAWYHGHGRKAPYFEGWYFKIINAAEDRRYAFIPGVFINADSSKTHAFIQVLDGMAGTAAYHRYGNFEATPNAFDIRIGESYFRQDRIVLNIADELGSVSGELRFKDQTPWPVTVTSPGFMGWYGWLPNMECNHGVLSFDHAIEGSLEINGEVVDFNGGRGYIEKDWGQSFPSGYVWIQSNHFETPHTSITASIASVPNVGREFAGFTVGLWHENALYRFATYNNSHLDKLEVTDTHVEWHLHNAQHELHLSATRAEGGLLLGPQREDMHMRVDETMKSSIDVALFSLDGVRRIPLFSGTGRNAALEVVNFNNVERLAKRLLPK